ncbi:MAG: response regulator [Candidatus Omnitrophica bacterium]|nr:response regulator [Candidatus Omnitrophota bacterium]
MADRLRKGLVLIVDDEEPIRESLSELLEACRYEVLVADCVDNAIKVIDKHADIDAIISDLKMPGKPGTELLHYIYKTGKKIPLMFLTGFATLETCQQAVREGAFDYILKPIDDKDKILMPLKHAIDQSGLEKKNKELQQEILRMAEEHQELMDQLLDDAETRDIVQKKINDIVEKWKE